MAIYWEDVEKELTANMTKEELDEIDFVVELTSAIENQRQRLGLTQRQVAERAGIRQSALHRVLSASVVPRIGTILKIARALNLKLTITLSEEEEEAATAEVISELPIPHTHETWQPPQSAEQP
jgi:transcriptional regulator with XRE-family HTH domain